MLTLATPRRQLLDLSLEQLFLNRYATSLPTRFPLNFVLAIVERPSLRLRQRIQRTLHPEAEHPAPAA